MLTDAIRPPGSRGARARTRGPGSRVPGPSVPNHRKLIGDSARFGLSCRMHSANTDGHVRAEVKTIAKATGAQDQLPVTQRKAALRLMVDAAKAGGQPLAAATPLGRDDLSCDADRGLLWGTCAQIQSDRRREPRQIRLGNACLAQAR